MNYRYTLEPYRGVQSRYTCPACGQKRQFVRYIDTTTGQHLGDEVGRCNREYQCGYHLKPKDISLPLTDEQRAEQLRSFRSAPLAVHSTLSMEDVAATLGDYESNHFMRFLRERFGADTALKLAERYKIGTNHYWDSSTVFWQIDAAGRVRTGKVMLYNPKTGKRLKDEVTYIHWMHRILRRYDFTLKQCFFGEHLLPQTTGRVAIVESEKTAIIASVYLPEYTWLAAGSAANLSVEKCSVLQGRPVVLFPDTDAHERWAQLADMIPNCRVQGIPGEAHPPGYDLADYLLAA